jgi:iron complex outermembrane recepter protein
MKKSIQFLTVVGAIATASAQTPEPAADEDMEEVVVTGTSIRGTAPIGTQLVTLDAASIQAVGATNTADLLASMPMFNSFNIAPQGGQAQFNSGGSSTPGLHGLPGTAMLVLIDGHRAVGDTPLLNIPDPSSIPPSAIERIEIIADGGSAIYGSDAVAGVMNIILKKGISGAETTGSFGAASPYEQTSIGQMFGTSWDSGSAMIAANYVGNEGVQNKDRDFYQAAPQGLAFSPVTNCNPPNVQINGVNYTNPGMVAGPPNTCDPNLEADFYNEQRRYSLIANLRQDIGDKVTFYMDARYSDDEMKQRIAQVSNQTIVIPDTNPFFTLPTGVSATSETVYWNTGNLNTQLWDEYTSKAGMLVAGINVALGTWNLTTDLDYSWSTSSALNEDNGGVNITALNAAINGTTPETALDPFGNRTNPAVAAAILNYPLIFNGDQDLWDYNLKVDGPLMDMPGGQLKLAVGAGYRVEGYSGDNPIGVEGDADYSINYVDVDRNVFSVFAEVAVPIVGDANAKSGIQAMNFTVAVRYDDYSDFGNTTNPKYGIDWTPVDGFKLRASYGTSFHAPQLADTYGIDTRAGGIWTTTPRPGFIAPPGAIPTGAYIAGGREGLVPEEAENMQFGFDWEPAFLSGFKTSISWWSVDFSNQVQIPVSFNLNIPGLQQRFVFMNVVDPATGLINALTPEQFAAALDGIRLTGSLTTDPPPEVWDITDARRANIGEAQIRGIDFDLNYHWNTDSAGEFFSQLAGEYIYQYDTNAGAGTEFQDNLTNGSSTQSSDSSAYNIIPWRVQGSLGWRQGSWMAQGSANYTGHYNFGYSTPCGNTNCNAIQWVSEYLTFDAVASYQIREDLRFQLNVENITDEDPPLTMQTNGFSALSANPLGRLYRVGLEWHW